MSNEWNKKKNVNYKLKSPVMIILKKKREDMGMQWWLMTSLQSENEGVCRGKS